MLEGQTAYYRLDITPKCIETPSGNVIKKGEILHKGTGKFFYETDLYTTRYYNIANDEIEKYLFGKIDNKGSAAIKAMASPNWMREIRPHIVNYYEYLDAQRLRTPKGLAWLIKIINPRNHSDLLLKMQEVRRLHCTMWAEASMEIVSAEKSDIKFIVSDNPVTLYNSAFYPGDRQCKFPNDPGIELKGTRTIFPLDLNHCAVITNLEYARSPGKNKAKKPRTNPRYFNKTIIKYDDIIRERSLNEQQVLSINYILKSRAQRYIAAAKKDWLYPEMTLTKKDWCHLDKTFVSKSDKLLERNSEIFIGGGKDGRLLATQDEFGRKPKSKKEWEEKERQAQAMQEHCMKLLKQEKSNN